MSPIIPKLISVNTLRIILSSIWEAMTLLLESSLTTLLRTTLDLHLLLKLLFLLLSLLFQNRSPT